MQGVVVCSSLFKVANLEPTVWGEGAERAVATEKANFFFKFLDCDGEAVNPADGVFSFFFFSLLLLLLVFLVHFLFLFLVFFLEGAKRAVAEKAHLFSLS